MRASGTTNGIAWIAAGRMQAETPSLLFIHGAGGNSAGWWQQFDHFAPHRHVVAIDLPGFGRSDPPSPHSDPVEAMVQGAAGVCEALGLMRIDLVCQSLGGWAGLRLALSRPDLVNALVLCCTLAGIAHPPGLAAFREATARMDERGPAALGLQPQFETDEPAKALLYRHIAAANAPLDPAWGQRLFAPEVLIAPGQLAELAVPVTLIMGACDPIWPPDSLTGMLAAAEAREVVLSGAGHSPYFEQPGAFNAVLADALSAAS